MQKTGIEYLDYTWNPIAMRCSRVSPGCDNCWHLKTADRLCENPALPENERFALAGKGPFILRDRELSAPLINRKRTSSVIGVQFMGDFFHESISDCWRDLIMAVMIRAHWHTYIILTKRHEAQRRYMVDLFSDPAKAAKRLSEAIRNLESPYDRYELECDVHNLVIGYSSRVNGPIDVINWPPSHIWNMITICNQDEADQKLPSFLQIPGNKGLSIEPMLGEIDLSPWLCSDMYCCGGEPEYCQDCKRRSWLDRHVVYGEHGRVMPDVIILGGETGPGARPLHPDWVRSVRDQCAAAGVDFFLKFLNKKDGRVLDGKTHDQLPWRNHAI